MSLKPGSHVRSKRKGERNTPRFTREIVKQEQPQEEEKGGGAAHFCRGTLKRQYRLCMISFCQPW